MSDKLDDLFGAIDGDEEEEEKEDEEDRKVLDGTRAIEGLVPNSKPSEHDSNEPMIVSDHPALTNRIAHRTQGPYAASWTDAMRVHVRHQATAACATWPWHRTQYREECCS